MIRGTSELVENSACSVNIALTRLTHGSDWDVRYVECRAGRVSSKFTFHPHEALHSALVPKVALTLEHHLPKTGEPDIFSDRTFVLKMPKLVMGGLRVISQKSAEGRQLVSVKFPYFVGSYMEMVEPRHRAQTLSEDSMSALAGAMLTRLLQPCLDLARVEWGRQQPDGFAEPLTHWLGQLSKNKEDLEFYTSLLVQYVADHSQEEVPKTLHNNLQKYLTDQTGS
ncbi:MAG: hypothetical protein ACPGNV_17265 [Mangrovicoccus sp.]